MEYIASYTFEADESLTAYELYRYLEWRQRVDLNIKQYHWGLSVGELTDPFYKFDNWPDIPKEIERFIRVNMGEKPDFPVMGWERLKNVLGIS